MNKKFLAIASACIVIAILSPLASYVYFYNRFNATFESFKLQIWNIWQENKKLEELKKIDQNPWLIKPYLVTTLGWYLHDSSDPVPSSRNTFTIYGTVLNVGATTAVNCRLTVKFYDNMTLLQTSEIAMGMGKVGYWSDIYIRHVIRCDSADSVTRIEVTPKWSD